MSLRGRLAVYGGKADITPATMLPLFGRTGRAELASNIKSRLEANCLLVRGSSVGTAVLITIDSLFPSNALIEAVASACTMRGLPLTTERLMMVASHTHNAPSLDASKPKLGASAPAYLAFVATKISDCLLELSQRTDSEITNVASGHADCAASVYRRRALWGVDLARLLPSSRMIMSPNPSRRINQKLKLVLLKNIANQPKAVLWTWPCHAVSEPDPMAISADFPGALRNHIRTSFGHPDLPVLYFPGFSGDIRPSARAHLPVHKSGRWIGFGSRFARAQMMSARRLQQELAAAFDRARFDINHSGTMLEATLMCTQRNLPLTEIRDGASELPLLTCDDWQLGPIRIKAVSAEVASDYAKAAGESDPLSFTTGCAGQVFGYIPTDKQLSEGGYEVDGFAASFSVPGRFRDAIEEQVVGLIGT